MRYILRRNAERARGLASSREAKLTKLNTLVEQKNLYLATHPRAKVAVAQREIAQKAAQLKIDDWASVEISQPILEGD